MYEYGIKFKFATTKMRLHLPNIYLHVDSKRKKVQSRAENRLLPKINWEEESKAAFCVNDPISIIWLKENAALRCDPAKHYPSLNKLYLQLKKEKWQA